MATRSLRPAPLRRSALVRTTCIVIARQGGGPPRFGGGRSGGQRDGRNREGSPQPPQPKPRFTPIDLSKASTWWRDNVFKGAKIGPVDIVKLANGQAARPGDANAGKRVEIFTNHLLLGEINIRSVAQYEVQISKLPKSASGTDPTSPSSPKTPSAGGKSGSAGGPGGKGAAASRRDRAAKVTGLEARAVLSYLLDPTAKESWVYDDGAALYTVLQSNLAEDTSTSSGTSSGAVRQADGSLRVEVPREAGGEAAGSTYKVELRRTGLIDVQQALRGAQEFRKQRMAAGAQGAEAGSGGAADVAAEGLVRPAPSPPPLASEQAALAVLELVTRAEAVADPQTVRVGAGTFVSYGQEERATRISGMLPLQLLGGFRSSVSVVGAGTTLAIDSALAVVAQDGPLLAQLENVLGATGGALAEKLRDKRTAADLQRALEGLEVKNPLNNITFKLDGTLGKSAREAVFTDTETGKQVSVAQYFRNKYGHTLRHPDLPCVSAKKGKALLPLEVLTVTRSQKRMSRLTDRAKADFIRAAAKRPRDRFQALQQALRGLLGGVGGPVARAFGLAAVGMNFLKVAGRLLRGPLLEVSDRRRLVGLDAGNAGEWQSPGVAAAGTWTSGAVLSYLDSNQDAAAVTKFVSQLRESLQRQGAAAMPDDLPVVWASAPRGGKDPDRDARDWLQRAVSSAEKKYKRKPELVLVLLPAGRGGSDMYKSIKRAGDGELGVVTQCVEPFKASLTGSKSRDGPPPSYTNLLALGVNAKVGGTTSRLAGRPADWVPALGGRRLMVLGADVSRGAGAVLGGGGSGGGVAEAEEDPASAAGIEYAAVVGSVDSHCTQYAQSLSAQRAGNRDIILAMQHSVEDLLRSYAARSAATIATAPAGSAPGGGPRVGGAQGGRPEVPVSPALLPEALLMYRDGVGNSMFDTVLAHEYTAIKEACAAVGGPGYQPPVTFMVVQKSHNTRLFPASEAEAHRSGNVQPGTLVDQGVVEAEAFEFFLNSHAGIQGTNRVPKYRVLVDEFGFSADDLPLLTFALCHTYPTCNRSISLPPAARLAHLGADRARTAVKAQVSRTSGQGWFEVLGAPLVDASSVV